MTHKIKVLGLSFVAVLAMSSVAATAAQAASGLDVEATPAFITGEQLTGPTLDKFTFGGGVMLCSKSSSTITTTATKTEDVTVVPDYLECQFGGLPVHLNFNGCQYTYTGTATALVMNMDIVCPAGKDITVQQTATGCVVTVKAQGPLSKITFSNVAGFPPHVNAKNEITGLHYEGNASCPVGVSGTRVDGQLAGTTTLKGFKDVAGVEKAQVSVQAT